MYYKTLKSRLMLVLGVALAGVTAPFQAANAGLTITPIMVLIEGRERGADVALINPDQENSRYEMGWRYFEMQNMTGTYKNIQKSTTDFDLAAHLALTPKRVTLAPKTTQKIRMALRLNGEPPAPGDYRAHLEFRSSAEQAPIDPATPKDATGGKAEVGVRINTGFSIPVVYRVGESTDKVTIGDVTSRINPKTNRIQITVPLDKTKSAFGSYGTLNVDYGGKNVGKVRNANIFPEITARTFDIDLTVDKIQGGILKITYVDFRPTVGTVIAQKDLTISK